MTFNRFAIGNMADLALPGTDVLATGPLATQLQRLGAIATEIAEIGTAGPQWSQQRRYAITLAYEWVTTPLSLLVRRYSSQFEVMFVLKSEVEQLCFRPKVE
jgi:hypothetical protein